MRITAWWRHVALAGLTAGLAASPWVAAPRGWPLLLAAAPLAALTRPARGGLGALAWLALFGGSGALIGLGVGGERIAAIASGAAPGTPGERVVTQGYVATVPRGSFGELRFGLETDSGRFLVSVSSGPDPPTIGARVAVSGRLAEPEAWRAAELERFGARLELRARRVRVTGGGRGGLTGLLDRSRRRAERAVAAGLDPSQAALARGFVLGEDEAVDERTREQFRRSGLAHLLAVSGQNVMLLAILAGVLLALLGLGPRARLLLTVLLIAAYVPLAGAGPSIQRAGVMGVAAIGAGLAGRAVDRAYTVLLAAAATLLLSPWAAADVGWQLSFAAVLGIALWAAPMRALLAGPLARTPLPARLAEPLAEGAGLTLAATLATAPLMALHFETVSVASLPANLVVLPAVAPVMWLGMLAALIGQLPFVPTAPLALIEGPLLDFITAVAGMFSRPGWAVVRPGSPSPAAVIAVYLGLLAGVGTGLAALRRRRGLSVPPRLALVAAATAAVAGLALLAGARDGAPGASPGTIRVSQLDVGQGDAILIDGSRVGAVLVDTGPPGTDLPGALRDEGVRRLRAVFITHDQRDHAGGLNAVLRSLPVDRLVLGRPAPELVAAARAAGARVERVGEGAELSFGPLLMQVLAPRSDEPPAPDPNADSLVMAARFEGWTALLTGDAEAEASPVDPGPVDVLKLAHHGSEDGGLARLLDRSVPRVALIGVGAHNPYGHPAPESLRTLGERHVCVLRTDLEGDLHVELGPGSLRVWTERASGGDRCRI